MLGKMLLLAAPFQCFEMMLTICASLGLLTDRWFVNPSREFATLEVICVGMRKLKSENVICIAYP